MVVLGVLRSVLDQIFTLMSFTHIMDYCKRCCYPANARPAIIMDEEGVCSGCRVHESRTSVDQKKRKKQLVDILEEYREKARKNGSPYDLIIPVSGGKDSHFQVHTITQLGFHPLLVSYNHGFNTARGIRNLTNMLWQFDGCNLLRFTTAVGAARRISRFMVKTVGDVTWHYHAGIMTFPIQVAVQYKTPLILWGEHGFSDMLGMYNQEDMLEFSRKDRREHSMRGFEPEDILNHSDNTDITEGDLAPFHYPDEEEIEAVGVRGIYLANFLPWNAREQTKNMIENFNFETAVARERTHHLYDKLDDIHANGFHDYLKYLKFGYGRATDDVSNDIRGGRLTREEGINIVQKYDHVRPGDLDIWLRFVDMTEEELLEIIAPLRDPQMWEKDLSGQWHTKDSVANHINDSGVDSVRMPQVDDREMLRSYNQPERDPRHMHFPEDSEYIWI